MKKINFIIIILLILSCAGSQKKRSFEKDTQHKSKISIYSQHWNILEDSLNFFLHMEFPLNQLVFRKSAYHFYSDIAYTLVISHAEKNLQVYRESWNEQIIQPYYEDTRNSDNYYTTEKNITLSPGTYKLFFNVQDEDSRQNWQFNKEYKLESVNGLGPILPFINNENFHKIIAINTMAKIDTIWLRTQIHLIIQESESKILQDTIPDSIDYIVSREAIQIDSGKVNLSEIISNQLYYIPIPFKESIRGLYEITLRFKDFEQTTSFNYGNMEKQYWTDDIEELVGVMRYIIILHSEYKVLKEMDESSQWDYINKYWKEKDLSPETDENELLIQLNDRVKFVNKNFSILMPGWESDRGRIYIIYGPPQYDESYQDQIGYSYQKWIYPSGKQFIFIDRSMSGNYSLYREMY